MGRLQAAQVAALAIIADRDGGLVNERFVGGRCLAIIARHAAAPEEKE